MLIKCEELVKKNSNRNLWIFTLTFSLKTILNKFQDKVLTMKPQKFLIS